ncbi:S8 family serine peptidase [Saccharothrix sp. S26]|uniref:S8 family serine peptidase n=1 Tax=Saccharothrix sp. S26 TaxID=2907215 RepID=UPI001F2159E6|nr:S8 family serine peptidase [Saccharothrix sp. S26]MCE6997335.1 S8 family serine peptidase [Saccharothrix sp. S26]
MRLRMLGAGFGVLLGLVVAPSAVAQSAVAQWPRGEPVRHVTLVTGDRVGVVGDQVREIEPAPREQPFGYRRFVDRAGDLHVVPDDVGPMISDGRLDPRLFNVTELLRAGYDDATRADVPVLADGPSALPKDRTGRALRTMTRRAGKVWLDGSVRAVLDRTVPATGAPRAWEAGLTGKGVEVAVLDTGYDATHPDLAGKVVAARDFTDSGGPADDHGHGTHVAATIAGSGGEFTGVAPDARLLVGKVLDRTGRGRESQLIAGLRWAVEQGADVVNVSIGGYASDGTDPVSQTVDELTRQHGTLFVVAAGNSGPLDRTVTSPAVAAEALAVAAVDDAGAVPPFSSRGPVAGTGATKPDLAAPGVDVVAARAAGTSMGQPLDARHTQSSGTSMAAPHVAGGAALLAQQHPDWQARQLKAALMASANPTAATPVTAQGAGKLDLARATATAVTADRANVGFGDVAQGATAEQTVTYRNTGPAVRLRLRTDLGSVSPDTLTVPAGGTASATVSFRAEGTGPRSGRLVAEGGDVRVQTLLGANTPPPEHDITVRAVDETGPVPATLTYTDLDTGETGWATTGVTGRLPSGRYAIVVGGMAARGRFMIGRPEVVLDKDVELTADVRTTTPVTARFDQPVPADGNTTSGMGLDPMPQLPSGFFGLALGRAGTPIHMAIDPVKPEYFRFVHAESRFDLPLTTTVAGRPVQANPELNGRWPADPRIDTEAVHVGPDLSGLDLRGKVAVLSASADDLLPRLEALARAGAVMALHAGYVRGVDTSRAALPLAFTPTTDVIDLVDDGPVPITARWVAAGPHQYFATLHGTGVPAVADQVVRLGEMAHVRTKVHTLRPDQVVSTSAAATAGGREVGVSGGLVRGAAEQVVHHTPGAWRLSHVPVGAEQAVGPVVDLSAGQHAAVDVLRAAIGPSLAGLTVRAHRERDTVTVDVPMLSDARGQHLFDSRGDIGTTVHRDGQEVLRVPERTFAEFAAVPDPARYRVESWQRGGAAGEFSTDVRAVWDFRSRHTDAPTALPLMVVRFAPEVDLANRAAGGPLGVPFTVQRAEGATPWPVFPPTAEVSYDDGATWRNAVVRGGQVLLDAPRAGYVSLRVKVKDFNGASVEQTVVRAFGLR